MHHRPVTIQPTRNPNKLKSTNHNNVNINCYGFAHIFFPNLYEMNSLTLFTSNVMAVI